MSKLRVAIIGTTGLPARYGGFETLHILGNFYLASGDGKTAKKIYMRAQQLDPNNIAILRQITLADEMSDGGVEESIPTDLPAVARLLQRLTGTSQAVS